MIKALDFALEQSGKTFSGSKTKYTWKYQAHGEPKPRFVVFTNSKMSGKKKIYIDGTLQHEQQVFTNSHFQYTWPVGDHLLAIIPEENEFTLTIDGVTFESIKRQNIRSEKRAVQRANAAQAERNQPTPPVSRGVEENVWNSVGIPQTSAESRTNVEYRSSGYNQYEDIRKKTREVNVDEVHEKKLPQSRNSGRVSSLSSRLGRVDDRVSDTEKKDSIGSLEEYDDEKSAARRERKAERQEKRDRKAQKRREKEELRSLEDNASPKSFDDAPFFSATSSPINETAAAMTSSWAPSPPAKQEEIPDHAAGDAAAQKRGSLLDDFEPEILHMFSSNSFGIQDFNVTATTTSTSQSVVLPREPPITKPQTVDAHICIQGAPADPDTPAQRLPPENVSAIGLDWIGIGLENINSHSHSPSFKAPSTKTSTNVDQYQSRSSAQSVPSPSTGYGNNDNQAPLRLMKSNEKAQRLSQVSLFSRETINSLNAGDKDPLEVFETISRGTGSSQINVTTMGAPETEQQRQQHPSAQAVLPAARLSSSSAHSQLQHPPSAQSVLPAARLSSSSAHSQLLAPPALRPSLVAPEKESPIWTELEPRVMEAHRMGAHQMENSHGSSEWAAGFSQSSPSNVNQPQEQAQAPTAHAQTTTSQPHGATDHATSPSNQRTTLLHVSFQELTNEAAWTSVGTGRPSDQDPAPGTYPFSVPESATIAPAPRDSEPATTAPAPRASEPATTAPAPRASDPATTAPAPLGLASDPATTAPAPRASDPATTAPAPRASESATTAPAPPRSASGGYVTVWDPATERITTKIIDRSTHDSDPEDDELATSKVVGSREEIHQKDDYHPTPPPKDAAEGLSSEDKAIDLGFFKDCHSSDSGTSEPGGPWVDGKESMSAILAPVASSVIVAPRVSQVREGETMKMEEDREGQAAGTTGEPVLLTTTDGPRTSSEPVLLTTTDGPRTSSEPALLTTTDGPRTTSEPVLLTTTVMPTVIEAAPIEAPQTKDGPQPAAAAAAPVQHPYPATSSFAMPSYLPHMYPAYPYPPPPPPEPPRESTSSVNSPQLGHSYPYPPPWPVSPMGAYAMPHPMMHPAMAPPGYPPPYPYPLPHDSATSLLSDDQQSGSGAAAASAPGVSGSSPTSASQQAANANAQQPGYPAPLGPGPYVPPLPHMGMYAAPPHMYPPHMYPHMHPGMLGFPMPYVRDSTGAESAESGSILGHPVSGAESPGGRAPSGYSEASSMYMHAMMVPRVMGGPPPHVTGAPGAGIGSAPGQMPSPGGGVFPQGYFYPPPGGMYPMPPYPLTSANDPTSNSPTHALIPPMSSATVKDNQATSPTEQ